MNNRELVEIYAENQAEVDEVWLEMPEETTLGEAVREWQRRTAKEAE